jgi:hypothetical protein
MADMIRLDPQYLSEYSKKLKNASGPVSAAQKLLEKAKMSSGWFSSQRDRINSDIGEIMRETTKISGDADAMAGYLLSVGVISLSEWARDTQTRESALVANLSKAWGFEAGNWSRGGNSGSTNVPTTPVPGFDDAPQTGDFTLNDISYYRDKYAGNEGNCKAFVNAVIKGELGANVPQYTSKLYELNGLAPVGQVVYNPSNPFTGDDVKNMFSNAKVGDVVQMQWTYGMQTQHTAVFAGFDGNGNVSFLESNVGKPPNISVHSYTLENLRKYYSQNGNGASIYHFG